ncbi:MAG TPA: DUF3043 domain-containing protein [Frankiaceae bacterium]|jgi:hypothetical protein|nr:DUF3043 domain-containing protein [Frankiaceae bacterium]
MTQTKGRPTPKRSEREAARRKPLVQPRTRETMKASRSASADERRRQREAMRNGDERNYPAIAAGPERALVRDVIDARRPYWMYALPVWAVGAVLSITASPVARAFGTLTLPIVVLLLLGDLVAARRSVRRALRQAYPQGTREAEKALIWYGTARNMQFRRSRLPRPRTEPGTR